MSTYWHQTYETDPDSIIGLRYSLDLMDVNSRFHKPPYNPVSFSVVDLSLPGAINDIRDLSGHDNFAVAPLARTELYNAFIAASPERDIYPCLINAQGYVVLVAGISKGYATVVNDGLSVDVHAHNSLLTAITYLDAAAAKRRIPFDYGEVYDHFHPYEEQMPMGAHFEPEREN